MSDIKGLNPTLVITDDLHTVPGLHAFAVWRSQQGYDIRTDKERDLIAYIAGLLTERNDLETRCVTLMKSNANE